MTRPRATPPDTERLIASAREVARVWHRPWDEGAAKQAAADAGTWLADIRRLHTVWKRAYSVEWYRAEIARLRR